VVGDPAVRLMLVHELEPVHRPVLEVISVPEAPSPSQQVSSAPSAIPVNAALVDYGVIDSVRGAAASLQDAAQKIGAWLADSFQTVTNPDISQADCRFG